MQSRAFAAALGLATLVLCVDARPAHAEAWAATHKWSDKARPDDPTSGSFAYEYAAESESIAESIVASGEAFDCSKFAMTVLVRYAQKHGLEVRFTLNDPANGDKVDTVSSSDARFKSPGDFRRLYMGWINAEMVAEYNTYSISYDEWRSGDLVLMRWNQLGKDNPFYPRDVWHTYFVGEPGKVLFYGNENGKDPTPVTRTTEQGRLDEVQCKGSTGKAVYGQSPRRWKMLKNAIIPPQPANTGDLTGTVKTSDLNIRSGPSTSSPIVGGAHEGDELVVEGRERNGWLRIRRDDGSIAYVSGAFVKVTERPTAPVSSTPEEAPRDGMSDMIPIPH
jgi:hypothetical protein